MIIQVTDATAESDKKIAGGGSNINSREMASLFLDTTFVFLVVKQLLHS
jgi:hypothetical protein